MSAPFVSFCLTASNAVAQSVQDNGTTSRGLISDAASLIDARDAASNANLDCEVTSALFRGRDENRSIHYEVACRNSLGYLIVSGASVRAYDCLPLASQNRRARQGHGSARFSPSCRLPTNRNPARRLAQMARQAGLMCVVDDGSAFGLTASGNPLYEIGCPGRAGVWLEKASTGWIMTDCLTIRTQQGRCQFTTEVEERATFTDWLEGTAIANCNPSVVRGMGMNTEGLVYYEVVCGTDQSSVVLLDLAHKFVRAIPCSDAAHIGNGCKMTLVFAQ